MIYIKNKIRNNLGTDMSFESFDSRNSIRIIILRINIADTHFSDAFVDMI